MEQFDARRVPAGHPIQVVIPAKVAFDIDSLFEVQRSVFERLGHPGCYSGADIRFMLEREFFVDPTGKLTGRQFGE